MAVGCGGGGGKGALGASPPEGLAYARNPAVYTVGVAIAPNLPSSGGGAPTRYSVSPALPAGLALDEATGAISGTPAAPSAQADYVVLAENAQGSARVTLTLEVNPPLIWDGPDAWDHANWQ